MIAYALPVGLPILGLVRVLTAGRNLTVPISVNGVRKFERDASRLAAMPCGTLSRRLVSAGSNKPGRGEPAFPSRESLECRVLVTFRY
jgi:hypothetical protein